MSANEHDNPLVYHDGYYKYKNIKSILVYDGGMTEKPTVSIMIPTYRRPELLCESIESALAQETNISYEVIVVDNESNPEFSGLVDRAIRRFTSHNFRVYRNEANLGMFGNWNRCLELANGKYVTILSDDDVLKPNFIQYTMSHVSGREFVAVNVTHFGRMLASSNKTSAIKNIMKIIRNRVWYKWGERRVRLADIMIGNPVAGILGVLLSKDASIELGGFNENYWPSADYLFISKYWLHIGGKILENEAAAYRWEINESFKPATAAKFIEVNSILRHAIIEHIKRRGVKTWLLEKTKDFQTYLQANLYIEKFHLEDNCSAVFKAASLKNVKIPFPQAVSWLLLLFFYLFVNNKRIVDSKLLGN